MADPHKYMEDFDYQKPVSIPQLVTLHCILTEYDVEGERQTSRIAKDGSTRVIPIPLATSTTASLQTRTGDTIYDKQIDKYVNMSTQFNVLSIGLIIINVIIFMTILTIR